MNEQIPREGTGPGDRVGTDGRYELLDLVGSGGMGSVYRARDHKLGCDRAVKVLEARYTAVPNFVERFLREARAASRVTHPNIVSVLDVAGEGERPVFLVMELLEGQTLSQMVKNSGRMPWAQVQRYIDQIAAGLGAAHAQGVVHRDVKPGNCVVLPDDQVKILDFGIAKVKDEALALTAAGEIIGTCSYMAPEQIKGQVDKRSDIYALGVVTFRLLTGRVPFSHREQDKVLLAHLTEPPPAPSSLVSGLPKGLDELVLRMLAKQPHQRFADMEELRRALAGIERGSAVAIDAATVAPGGSRTAMFEDALTQAVPREATPSGEAKPQARPGINTAPAGSGTLAQLELDVGRMPGTVVLDEGRPSGGGTMVVRAQTEPAGPVAAPFGGVTAPSPVPRALGNLAVSAPGPRRVTRFTGPNQRSDGGVVRGVVAAIGGIALAALVISGWVMWKRQAAEAREVAPAAAPAVVVDAEAEIGPGEVAEPVELAVEREAGAGAPVADVDAAAEVAKAVPSEPAVEPAPGVALESGAQSEPPPQPEAKAKSRRNSGRSKTTDAPAGEPKAAAPEPQPEPQDDGTQPKKKKRKSGDLRDPF